MKKISLFSFCLLWLLPTLLLPQTDKKEEPQLQKILEGPPTTYSPEGRRDPFKDLLAGKEVREKSGGKGEPQLSIDDLNLIGIVKSKGKLTAVISGSQGFPFYLKEGDKLSDGYVLSVKESQVIFRKTNERGIPLLKPKDIVKEITPEER